MGSKPATFAPSGCTYSRAGNRERICFTAWGQPLQQDACWIGSSSILPTPYVLEDTLARVHPLSIAVLRFGGVFTLEESGRESAAPALHPLPSSCVERRDIAQAYGLALTRPLPSPFEVFHIFHQRPGERFPIDKARQVLGFEPRYNCEELWRRGQQ